MVKYCWKCNKGFADKYSYCPYCGISLKLHLEKTSVFHSHFFNVLIAFIILLLITFFIMAGTNFRNVTALLIIIALFIVLGFRIIVEFFLFYEEARIFLKKHSLLKETPRIFEYAFFLSLFIATIAATFAAAAYYLPGQAQDAFSNFLVMIVFYCIALTCGMYLYIFRSVK